MTERMEPKPDQNIQSALDIARQLLILADHGEVDSRDDGCLILYGIISDCAYKIISQAKAERVIHSRQYIETGNQPVTR